MLNDQFHPLHCNYEFHQLLNLSIYNPYLENKQFNLNFLSLYNQLVKNTLIVLRKRLENFI